MSVSAFLGLAGAALADWAPTTDPITAEHPRDRAYPAQGAGVPAAEPAGPPPVQVAHEHEAHKHGKAAPGDAGCEAQVHITEAAEKQPGGALYSGPLPESGMEHAEKSLPEMKGAHMHHEARHGGRFFMAPDQLHHLEATHSPACGFRLFFYNAFIKPISAGRFRGFIKLVPKDEDALEVLRFLSPAKGGTVLHAPFVANMGPLAVIELYVKFPESEEPQLFTVHPDGRP